MRDTNADRAREEAAAWFARLSKLSVTTDALREFREWKQQNGNAAAYAEVEAAWDASGRLSDDPRIQALTRDAFALSRPGRKARRRRRVAAGLGGAALACGALAAAWMSITAPTTYRTGIGEQRLVVLTDGSRVRLNTDSLIRVRMDRDLRKVELARGEAFFEVRHDATRPFTVLADGAHITDLGTKFDVRRTAQDVRVTLVEGAVTVAAVADRPAVTLQPNQELRVSGQGGTATRSVDAAQASSWTTGRLIFQGEALKDAVAEVNRYSTSKILIEGSGDLANQPVNGVFDVGDTAAFIAAARTLFSLNATVDAAGATHLAPATPDPRA